MSDTEDESDRERSLAISIPPDLLDLVDRRAVELSCKRSAAMRGLMLRAWEAYRAVERVPEVERVVGGVSVRVRFGKAESDALDGYAGLVERCYGRAPRTSATVCAMLRAALDLDTGGHVVSADTSYPTAYPVDPDTLARQVAAVVEAQVEALVRRTVGSMLGDRRGLPRREERPGGRRLADVVRRFRALANVTPDEAATLAGVEVAVILAAEAGRAIDEADRVRIEAWAFRVLDDNGLISDA